QKQAELALRNSEHRYSTLAESSPVGIFRFNASGQCIYVNSRWCEMTGRSASDAYGDGWQNALHPDDFEVAAWHKALEQPSALRSQGRHVLPDGMIRWIDSQMVPEYDATGKFMGYIGTVSDITERKQAEEALRLSEARLRALVDSLPCGVWARDAEDRLILQNPVDVAYYGDKMGTSVEDLGLTPDLIAHYEEVKRRCQAGEVVSIETTEEINGEEKTFHRLVTVLRESNGRIGTLGIAIDVTEQRRTAKALQTSEDRLRRLIDALPLGIWLRDAGDRLVLQNQEDIDRYGNIIGTRLDENELPPERLDRYEQVKEQCLAGNVVRYETTETIHGEEHTFLRINATLPDFEGGAGIFGAVIDITERKRTEQALAISEERLKRLIDALPIGIWMYDANDYLILQNQEDIARYGQLLGTHLDDIGFSEEQMRLHANVREQCLAGDLVHQYEAVEVINGQERTLLRISAALPDFEGGIGMFGASIDISEQKHIENDLRQSEERFRAIFENAGIGMALLEAPEWNLTMTNPAFQRLIGYSAEELATLEYTDFTHPEDLAIEAPLVQECVEGDRTSYALEKRYIHKDGETVWVHLTASIVRDERRRAQQSIFTIEDITARKRSEESARRATNALLEVEARQRLILEAIPDLMHLFDADGTLLDSIRNVPGKNLLPNPSQAIGRNLLELIPQVLAERQIQGIQTALETGEIQIFEQQIEDDAFREAHEREGVSLIPDGYRGVRYEELRVVPTANNQVLILVRDISDRKHAELALAQSEYRQRTILRVIPELIGWFNRDGVFLEWYGAETIYDLVPGDINPVGKSYHEVVPPDIASRLTTAIQHALDTGIEQHYDQQLQFGDTVQHEEIIVVPTDEDEALMVVRDVSDRKALENYLRETRQTLQDILDHVDASIIRVHVFDSGDLSTEFISAGCEVVFGYTPDELLGDRTLWMSRVPIDDVETIVIPSRQRVCEAGHDSITYRFRHKNGELRHIHSRAIAHRDDNQRCWVITAIETVLHPPIHPPT
ncbi:MAG: PAS domain S-box protein, partial [Leptolyngbyaceae bacterium]|nr:PAS domain S-box protein [Leptolyngbyaceae bacterium]